METQVKEKTEVNTKKVEDYLRTVSKHLFLTENKRFFKAFPMEVNDKLYCIRLEFDGREANYVSIMDVDYYINAYGNIAKCVIGDIMFPPHINRRASIPNFKAMREKVEEIQKIIAENFNGTNRQEIEKEIKKVLIGLSIKEKEI
jgi:hypothetical protein